MKSLAGIVSLVALVTIFLLPKPVLAETNINVSNNADGSNSDVHVNSQSSGQSITCVNGNCTTTGGGSKTTVCVNGNCSTSDDGSVNYNSPDGHTHVQINNNSSGNSTSITSEPTTSPSPKPTITLEPSMTPDPTITQMRNDINNHVQKELEGIKEHVKNQNAAISDFIKAEMDALQNMLNNLFK